MSGDSLTNVTDLEGRLRGLILSNANKQDPGFTPAGQGNIKRDDIQHHQGPPHMQTTSLVGQQDRLRDVRPLKEKRAGIAENPIGQTGGLQSPQKRLNQAQRRQEAASTGFTKATRSPVRGNGPQMQGGTAPGAPFTQQSYGPPIATNKQPQVPPTFRQLQTSIRGSHGQGRSHMPGQSFQPRHPQQYSGRSMSKRVETQEGDHKGPSGLNAQPETSAFGRVRPSTPPKPSRDPDAQARALPQNRQLFQPNSQRSGNGSSYGRSARFHQPSIQEINAQASALYNLAKEEVANAEMDAEEFRVKETFRASLEQICQDAVNELEEPDPENPPRVILKCFGSLRSGFATKSSDMDLALLPSFSGSNTRGMDLEIPRLLEKAFLDKGYGARLLTRTRVPIIKLCELPTEDLLEGLRKERERWEIHGDEVNEEIGGIAKSTRGSDPIVVAEAPIAQDPDPSINPMDAGRAIQGVDEAIAVGADRKTSLTPILRQQTIARSDTDHVHVAGEPPKQQSIDPDSLAKSSGLYSGRGSASGNPLPTPKGSEQDGEDSIACRMSSAVYEFKNGGDPLQRDQRAQKDEDDATANSEFQIQIQKGDLKGEIPPPVNPHPTSTIPSLEFPKVGIGIQCDINFSNPLALHNTHLLRCYSACDPRVRPMVIFVKAWAKRRAINSPYHGTLSSYGYVLLVLHYLTNIVCPLVTPNLQLAWRPPQTGSWTAALEAETRCGEYDIRFWGDEREIRERAERGLLSGNMDSVGTLLRGFFQYYAQQGPHVIGGGFSWTQDVVSIRTQGGLLSKQQKEWTGARTVTEGKREIRHRYLVAIEDPFEIEHNVGRTVTGWGIVVVRDEFRRAWRLIGDVGRRRPISSTGTSNAGGEQAAANIPPPSPSAPVAMSIVGPESLKALFDVPVEREVAERERSKRIERERAERIRAEMAEREKVRVEKEKAEHVWNEHLERRQKDHETKRSTDSGGKGRAGLEREEGVRRAIALLEGLGRDDEDEAKRKGSSGGTDGHGGGDTVDDVEDGKERAVANAAHASEH